MEDRTILLQRRIDEGIMSGRLTRIQGREFLQQIKDRKQNSERQEVFGVKEFKKQQ